MSDIDKVIEERDRARGEVMNLTAQVQELEHQCDNCAWNIGRTLRLQEEWESLSEAMKEAKTEKSIPYSLSCTERKVEE